MLGWLASKLSSRAARNPGAHENATANHVRALVAAGSLREAEDVLRAVLRRSPSAAFARMLGALYASQERHDEAIEYLAQALELDPRHAA
ncbi:MAG: tetratricopeptide repeat protein, partial [Betaproteobacteria bacterium]|nr:tetratricopeptide repeat protein [Betaproteobacteria bacterium]